MLTKKKSITAGIFLAFIFAVVMGGIRDNEASSIYSSLGQLLQMEANSSADPEISFMCIKDDDVFVVSMARSAAKQRDGRWYLPGHGQCSYTHWTE